jgi:hypothetical protein
LVELFWPSYRISWPPPRQLRSPISHRRSSQAIRVNPTARRTWSLECQTAKYRDQSVPSNSGTYSPPVSSFFTICTISLARQSVQVVPCYLNPQAEHLLDWFHLTMRITVLTQQAKGLRCAPETSPDVAAQLQRVKWFLWHGNVFRARQTVDDLTTNLTDVGDESGKLAKAIREFGGYLAANASAIPNYGERRLAGEIISPRSWNPRSTRSSANAWSKAADALEPPRRAPTTSHPHPRPQRHPRRRLPALVPRLHPHNRSRASGRVASHGLSRSPIKPLSSDQPDTAHPIHPVQRPATAGSVGGRHSGGRTDVLGPASPGRGAGSAIGNSGI